MRRQRWTFGLALTLGVLTALIVFARAVRSNSDDRQVRTAIVRRIDLNPILVAYGRLQSSNSTEIRCALQQLTGAGTSTILSLIPDGTTVKQGDVLGELDSSTYQELVRQQTITVEQARALQRQAELDLEVAQIELDAYRQGEMLQNDRLFRSQITMAQADLTRQADRLKWDRRMIVKGYASPAQVGADELSMRRLTLSLAQAEMAFRNYQRFTAPKELLAMKSQVIGTTASLAFQSIRLKREEERLALYQSMVDRCTIRAPHDGFVIYANRPGRPPEVELGVTVRQRQRLFTLPDLSKMEVQALLHETVVNRVRVGMPVRVRLEALPDLKLEGFVKSIAPLPYAERKSETGSTDVTYFQAQVDLTTAPEGLRPGMTAELAIAMGHREGVLAVPNAAVTDERGRRICRVLHPDRLEVRPVTLGEASHDLQEITEGLREGEEVALGTPPPRSDSLLSRAAGWPWN